MHFFSLLLLDLKYFTNFKNKMYQFLLFFQPLVFLTLLYFMLKLRGSTDKSMYIFGVGIISSWGYVLYSSGSALINEKWKGTLELVIATNTTLFKVIFSKTINNSLIGFISFFITYLYAIYLFNFNFHIYNFFYLFLALGVMFFSLISLGALLAMVFALFNNVYEYQNLILYPIPLLAGVFYSSEHFPLIIKWWSYLVPLTWSIKSTYITMVTDFDLALYLNYLLLSFTSSCVYLLFAYIFIKIGEEKLKEFGTMGGF